MANKTNFDVNGKSYYRVSLELGTDSNGKRKTKIFYGKSKKEAEQKKKDYINNLEKGITNNKVYLGNSMKVWLYEIMKVSGIKPSTFSRYVGIYEKYIEKSPLAPLELKDLQPIIIQKYYNKLFKNGTSTYSIKYLNKLLKQFLNYAVDNDYILKNPCNKKIIIPKAQEEEITEKEIPVFNNDEIKRMLTADEDTVIKYIALFSFSTGMRRGEILGLKESDINYEEGTINIKRTVATVYVYDDNNKKHKQTIVQTPKTKGSARTIPLPNSLIPIIKKAINLKNKNKLKSGSSFNKEYLDFLFLSEAGNLINASNLDKSWIYFLKRYNIPHKKFHALRHTYATTQYENGVKLKTISELLGHSDLSITEKIYTHIQEKEKKTSVDILENLSTFYQQSYEKL